jgi:hypothetical protein
MGVAAQLSSGETRRQGSDVRFGEAWGHTHVGARCEGGGRRHLAPEGSPDAVSAEWPGSTAGENGEGASVPLIGGERARERRGTGRGV